MGMLKGLGLVVALAAVCVGCGGGVDELAEGLRALEQGDYERAEPLLARSFERDRGNVGVAVALARVAFARGDYAKAREAIDAASVRAQDDVDVLRLGAQIAFRQEDYARAKELYAELATDVSRDKATRAVGWAGVGIAEMARVASSSVSATVAADRLDFARIAFLRALCLDPRNAPVRYHLGRLYREEAPRGFGYLEAAREQFDVYVRLAPESDEHVARVQSELPGLKSEIESSRASVGSQAAKRDGKASAAALQRAQNAVKAGKYEAASRSFAEALRTDALSFSAAKGLAETLVRIHKDSQALQAYRIACKLSPSSVPVFVKAGNLAMSLTRPATAVDLFSRAVAADPKDVSAIDGLIRALRAARREKVALAYQSYRDFLAASRR